MGDGGGESCGRVGTVEVARSGRGMPAWRSGGGGGVGCGETNSLCGLALWASLVCSC